MAGKSRGVGDDIAKITKATGIDKAVKKAAKALGKEDCGCKERQDLLNKIIPYGNLKENCMTADQVTEYEYLRDKHFIVNGKPATGTVMNKVADREDVDRLVALYNSVLNKNVKGCLGCNAGTYWIRLTNVYNKL
jgi:hypothetical protein